MRIILVFVFYFFFFGFGFGQSYRVVKTQNFNWEGLKVSRLGDLIGYNSDSILLKNKASQFVFDYSPFGFISEFHSYNGLKFSFLDKENQKIYFLDNTLSEQKIIKLPEELGWVTSYIWAENGNFWFFNANDNELILTDPNYQVLMRTGNLTLNYKFSIQSTSFFHWGQNIAVYNENEMLVFSSNGSFIQRYELKANKWMGWSKNELIGIDEKGLFLIETHLFHKQYLIEFEEIENFTIFEKQIYILSNNKLYIYTNL